MPDHHRAKVWGIGTLLVIVAVLAVAFALGGSGSSSRETGGASNGTAARSAAVRDSTGIGTTAGHAPAPQIAPIPRAIPSRVAAGAPGASGSGGGTTASSAVGTETGSTEAVSGTSLTAARVVKTGALSLRVDKGQVPATIAKLTRLARMQGGYVSSSRTDTVDNAPTGQITLRVPVDTFETAVSQAQQFGHEMSLSTSAHDVTGRYVDLTARKQTLERTRQTYLTILGRATTIGQTLTVQQRIEDVQQQIEQLQGQLKVLRNQSADGTLTVDVFQAGAPVSAAPHHRSGIGAAWHRSVDRFARGFDAIVAALGPILLALLVVAVLYLLGWLGLRRVRRATG